jgi:hypothetical protein
MKYVYIIIITGLILVTTSLINRKDNTVNPIQQTAHKGMDRENTFDGEYCFDHHENRPGYDFQENIFLDIFGGRVIGDKSGYVHSDDYSTSYNGELFGNISEDGVIMVVYDYDIEYDTQREEERYILEGTTLTYRSFQLTEDLDHDIFRINENSPVMIADTEEQQERVFAQVVCR